MKCESNMVIDRVVKNDYCVGCGSCASIPNSSYTMVFEDEKYIPKYQSSEISVICPDKVCPFSNSIRNENQIAQALFQSISQIQSDPFIGYYLKNFAGHVKIGKFREAGSSGGMGTWLATKLLEKKMVTKVIHVKPNQQLNGDVMFNYQISTSVSEIMDGTKSRYFPVEISQVIKSMRENPGSYAFIGVPCFVKAIRLIASEDILIASRLKYTIGLVCGHMKTGSFVKSMAWQMGINPKDLRKFDFRVKIEGRKSSQYGVEAVGIIDGKEVKIQAPTSSLFTTNWGNGFFKLNACDYCDDVLAETADITIGDAWLPEYVNDSLGTNIITIRHPDLLNLLEESKDELNLIELSPKKIYESQAGGFRHRRQGLSYRLYLKDQNQQWRPEKRFPASNHISAKRKRIYEKRLLITKESHESFRAALEFNDFETFKAHMRPFILDYEKLLKRRLVVKAFEKIKKYFSD